MGAHRPKSSTAAARTERRLGLVVGVLAVGGGALGLWWLLRTAPPPEAPPAASNTVVWVAADAGAPEPIAEPGVAAPANAATPAARAVRRKPKNAEEAVLAVPPDQRRVVINMGTLFASEMGQSVLRCMPRSDRQMLRRARAQGFDPFKRFEKVVVAGETAVVFGDFADDTWTKIMGDTPMRKIPMDGDAERFVPEAFGLTDEQLDEPGSFSGLTVWDGQALIGSGTTMTQTRAVLRRLRGEDMAEDAAPPLSTHGDIHGEVPGSDLIEALPLPYQVRRPLEEMLDGLGVRMQLEVDVSDRIDLRVGLIGTGSLVEEAVAAAIDTLRNAPMRGEDGPDEALRGVLNQLEVGRGKDGLRINLRVSREQLRDILGECVDNGAIPGDPDDVPEEDEYEGMFVAPHEIPAEVDLPEPVRLDDEAAPVLEPAALPPDVLVPEVVFEDLHNGEGG
jgi:hypothetical protein